MSKFISVNKFALKKITQNLSSDMDVTDPRSIPVEKWQQSR
jgi:hypothetical protein